MIKVDKGNVTVEGTGIDLLAEFACIVSSLSDHMPDFILRHAFETGLNSSKERDDKDDLIERLNTIEKLLKARG